MGTEITQHQIPKVLVHTKDGVIQMQEDLWPKMATPKASTNQEVLQEEFVPSQEIGRGDELEDCEDETGEGNWSVCHHDKKNRKKKARGPVVAHFQLREEPFLH